MRLRVREVARKVINHGAKDYVERLLLVDHIEQIVDVRDADLGGEAGVDGASLGSLFIESFIGEIGIDDVFRGNAQRLEVGAEDGVHGVHVEDARNADTQVLALLHQLDALLLLRGKCELWQRVDNRLGRVGLEGSFGAEFRHVGVVLFGGVQALLDLAHVGDVFHQALLATVPDDQALDARQDGDFRLLPGFVCTGDLHVNKRSHALVLAEIAARILAAMRGVSDLLDRFISDETGSMSVLIEPARFDGGADRARFPAVFVNNDVGFLPLVLESRFNEVHLRLDGSQVVLRPPLQDEGLAQRG